MAHNGQPRTVMSLHAIGPVPVADKYDRATDVALGPYWGFGQVYEMADAVEGERVTVWLMGVVPVGGTVESNFNYELLVIWNMPLGQGWSSSRILGRQGVSSKVILKVWNHAGAR